MQFTYHMIWYRCTGPPKVCLYLVVMLIIRCFKLITHVEQVAIWIVCAKDINVVSCVFVEIAFVYDTSY
jgi:hypothetical protein